MDTFYNKWGRRWMISKQFNPGGTAIFMILIRKDRELWSPVSQRIFLSIKDAKKFIDEKWGSK